MSETRKQQPSNRWTIDRHRTLVLAAGIATALLVACGGDTTGPAAPKSPVGAYAVATVNGKPLPYTMFSDTAGFKYEETAGTLALTSDGKYTFVTTYRQTVQTDVETFVDSAFGSWTQSDTALSFVDASDSTSRGTAIWAGTKLTFSFDGGGGTTTTVVYSRTP